MISVYQVDWMIQDGGPCIGHDSINHGDYHSDLYGTDIIPANSIKKAEEIVEMARPRADIIVVKRLVDLKES